MKFRKAIKPERSVLFVRFAASLPHGFDFLQCVSLGLRHFKAGVEEIDEGKASEGPERRSVAEIFLHERKYQ